MNRISRRTFIVGSSVAGIATGTSSCRAPGADKSMDSESKTSGPVVISTWNHGIAANAAAWKVLSTGGRALDAVEQGVRVTESDPNVRSVGLGGLPDLSGVVTLDACIMDERGDCGSVACLEEIENPISVARLVMEQTPHVMLVGRGASDFAVEQGFTRKNLLTPESEKVWSEWKERLKGSRPEINSENHDTIGLLALDADGNLSGACTTSGAFGKLPGRVGDSPIIGAGLFVDNEVGGACATGWGEAVIRVVGSHLVVELMRQGMSPDEACQKAVERVIEKNPDYRDIQVGFIALNKSGEHGSHCIHKGFNYAALSNQMDNALIDGAFSVTKSND